MKTIIIIKTVRQRKRINKQRTVIRGRQGGRQNKRRHRQTEDQKKPPE